jgi:general secretion pathway protein A
MFYNHFNMKGHPFRENPPIEWLLHDQRIEEAGARMKFFQEQGSVALITGQTGIGKSTLLRLFIHDLQPNRYTYLYLHLTLVNAKAFLRCIVTGLGETPKLGKDRLFMQILDRVKKVEKQVLLIIDEAHLIDPETLTDLRLLISSAVDTYLPLKIILCGQDPLRKTLKRSAHADLENRISVKCILRTFTKDQTIVYIDSIIRKAGGTDKIFDTEAKALIHDYTGGVPRIINNIATACLINAAAKNLVKISEVLVNETMSEFNI